MSHRDSLKLGMSFYCSLMIEVIQSGLFLLRGRSLWHWTFALFLLVLYLGITIPEGVDNFLEMHDRLFDSYTNKPKATIQLALILSFLIPPIAFTRLLIHDIRLAAADRKEKQALDAADDVPTT